jgi:hypothetical protein
MIHPKRDDFLPLTILGEHWRRFSGWAAERVCGIVEKVISSSYSKTFIIVFAYVGIGYCFAIMNPGCSLGKTTPNFIIRWHHLCLGNLRNEIEAQVAEHGAHPTMTWGEFGEDEEGAPCRFYATPRLPCENCPGEPDIICAHVRRITHMSRPEEIPRAFRHQVLMYWNLEQYRQILRDDPPGFPRARIPYTPTTEAQLEAFEREMGSYVVWAVGPAGWKGLKTGDTPLFMQYDPTNGLESAGHIFIAEKFSRPRWVDWKALENSP